MNLHLAQKPRLVWTIASLLLGAFTLGQASDTTSPPNTPSDPTAWEKFAGEWRAQPDAAQVVADGVHRATASMNFIARQIARHRLLQRFPAPAGLRLRRESDTFVIAFLGPEAVTHTLPISGVEVVQSGARLSVHLEGAALRHVGTTEEGRRENLFRLGGTSDALAMETTVTSPQLPEPVRYTLTFKRSPHPAH